MEDKTNPNDLTEKHGQCSFWKTSSFWSAIKTFAAAISAIAAVFSIMQAKDLSA
jgi:hypothetical protein